MLWSSPRLYSWTERAVFSQMFFIFQAEMKVNVELDPLRQFLLSILKVEKNMMGEDFATSEYI